MQQYRHLNGFFRDSQRCSDIQDPKECICSFSKSASDYLSAGIIHMVYWFVRFYGRGKMNEMEYVDLFIAVVMESRNYSEFYEDNGPFHPKEVDKNEP